MKLIKDLGTDKNRGRKRFGIYECPICKKHFETCTYDVINGKSTKCLSCSVTQRNTTHGETRTRLYNIWATLKRRALSSKVANYENISMCQEWNNYEVFKEWALVNGYKDSLSIDRIDNEGNYEPSNCRWANQTTQTRNTRIIYKHNTSGYRGVSFHKVTGKWSAGLSIKRKRKHIGLYNTKIEAAKAYNDYIDEYNLEHTKNRLECELKDLIKKL